VVVLREGGWDATSKPGVIAELPEGARCEVVRVTDDGQLVVSHVAYLTSLVEPDGTRPYVPETDQ
jgi:hypothetical protein